MVSRIYLELKHKFLIFKALLVMVFLIPDPVKTLAQASLSDTIRLEEIVVTGTPVKVNRNNIPLSVSVISQSQIGESGESALLPVLSGFIPGLFVTERGITGFGVSAGSAGQISIRGIGGNPTTGILVLIDGHPQFMGIMGHPLPDSYVASDVEKVEVIRGPASILYGSNAMGGVINIITKKQSQEGFHGNAKLSYGSFNTQKYMTSVGLKKNKFSAFASGNHDHTDGHRKNSDFSLNNGYLKFALEPNSHFYASADFNLTGFKATDPGPDTLNALPGQKIDIIRGYGALTFQNEFEKSSGALKLFYNFGKHNITDGFYSKDFNYGLNLYQSFSIIKNLNLTFGYDYMNYGGLAENRKAMGGKGILFADTSVVESGLYGFVQYSPIERLTLNGGLRKQNHSVYGNEWIPSGGFALKINNETTWKGTVSKGFRSPTVRELFLWGPNPDLQPERIMNYETGIIHTINGSATNLEITFFLIEGDNLIVNVPLRGLLNSGEISNKGIEFSAGTRINKNLELNCAYSYINMKKPLFATPQHQLFLSPVFRRNKLILSASVQLVLNLDTDPSPDVSKESYTQLKAKASYHFGKYLQIFVSGENLLNQIYEINRYYPMPGTIVFTGLNLTI